MEITHFSDTEARKNTLEAVGSIMRAILGRKSWLGVFLPTKGHYVFTGFRNTFNEDFCRENDVVILRTPNEGGTIVTSKGDISIAHISPDIYNTYAADCVQRVLDYLTLKGLQVSLEGNDVLVDGKYKVFSYSTRRFGTMLYTAAHCSIGCDVEIIRQITTKPMAKIPKGLADYGITTEEMLAIIEGCLEGVSDADAIYQ